MFIQDRAVSVDMDKDMLFDSIAAENDESGIDCWEDAKYFYECFG